MKANDWKWTAVLVLAGAAIFLPALGQEGSVTGSEARHAEIARTMLESGDYVVPHLCGRPYIDKPPLFNWTVAALFRLTGRVNFAVARLPSAVCSIAAMLGIYFLGRRWLSARAGACAALIWGTSWLVVEWGRFCQMDVMMTCLILYTVLLADVAAAQERQGQPCEGSYKPSQGFTHQGRPEQRRIGGRTFAAWLGACVLAAAATMSKGPPALLYFFVGAACAWRARRGRWLPNISLLLFAAVLTAAAWAAWLLPAEAEHPGHMRALLHYQAGEGPTEHRARITLYADQLLLRTAPWGIFALGASWWTVRRVRRTGYDSAAAPAFFLLVCLAIMTLVPNKREHYLLPVLPMWSLFIGGFLDRTLALREGAEEAREGEYAPKWLFEWPLRLCLALFLAAAVALAGFWGAFTGRDLAAGILLCAAVAGLAAYGLGVGWRARSGRSLAMLFSICFLVMATAYPLTLEVFNPPMRDLVELRRAALAIPPEAQGADLDARSPYLCFKLNRPLTYVKDAQEACRFLDGAGRRFLLLSSAAAGEVKGMTARPVREAGPYEIGAKSPMIVLEVGEAGSSPSQPPAR